MRITIDKTKCIGCMMCYYAVPSVFDMDGDNRSTVLLDTIPKELEEDCREAAADCRTQAIEIRTEAT